MSDRYLFVTGEGLGNIIQTYPAIISLVESGCSPLDLYLVKQSFANEMQPLFPDNVRVIEEVTDSSQYQFAFVTHWGMMHLPKDSPVYEIPRLKTYTVGCHSNEVDAYIQLYRDFIAAVGRKAEARVIYDVSPYIRCSEDEVERVADVAICNGYKYTAPQDKWELKQYPGFGTVVRGLHKAGYSCLSLGTNPDVEYVPGTIDCVTPPTSIAETRRILQGCRLVLTNDCGLFHLACALRIPTVVIFTFTSVRKNFHDRFHGSCATLLQAKCSYNTHEKPECHGTLRWKTCQTQTCRELDPRLVLTQAVGSLQLGIGG